MIYLLLVLSALITSSDAFVLTTSYPSAKRYFTAHETMLVPMAIVVQPSPVPYRCYYLLLHTSHRMSTLRKSTMRFEKRTFDDINDATSKGIVSLLTDVVNAIFDTWSTLFPRTLQSMDSSLSSIKNATFVTGQESPPSQPSSPLELLERIRNDYTERNYLWTGDLDVEANFVKSCRFTDPTLSFVGTDKYINNIQNLRPILNLVADVDKECRSVLMDIQLHDTYIETRWNMIGTLSRLPWQPKIDVIGKTKFWFQNDTNQIYFYDEIWEIPANQALLQLITPKQ